MDKWYYDFVKDELENKKLLSAEEYMQKQVKHLVAEHDHWMDVMQNGSGEMYWSDGVNMNLTRSHIKFYRELILAICEMYRMPLPAEYFIPVPPEVDDYYMADMIVCYDRMKENRRTIKKFNFRKPDARSAYI